VSIDEEFTRNGELMSLRLIYLHMIEEYARHLGHADLLRERIDGATGERPPGYQAAKLTYWPAGTAGSGVNRPGSGPPTSSRPNWTP